MSPAVAFDISAAATAAGVADGLSSRYRAAAPTTCGAAIEVPLSVLTATSLVAYDDKMLWPGAQMSRHAPKFENPAFRSVIVDAPTVIASPTSPGDVVHASTSPLPAAMAYVTPLAIEDR